MGSDRRRSDSCEGAGTCASALHAYSDVRERSSEAAVGWEVPVAAGIAQVHLYVYANTCVCVSVFKSILPS